MVWARTIAGYDLASDDQSRPHRVALVRWQVQTWRCCGENALKPALLSVSSERRPTIIER